VILLMYSAHCEIYERLTALWSSILCEKEELAMWHRRKCLMGDCPDYGLKLPSRRNHRESCQVEEHWVQGRGDDRRWKS
jgi:hypothetical protein